MQRRNISTFLTSDLSSSCSSTETGPCAVATGGGRVAMSQEANNMIVINRGKTCVIFQYPLQFVQDGAIDEPWIVLRGTSDQEVRVEADHRLPPLLQIAQFSFSLLFGPAGGLSNHA